MNKVQLSKNGPVVSKIIAGVMNWGRWGAGLGTPEMAKLINSCLANGISSFDHADIYGGHTTESEFGEAFKVSGIKRQDIEIITKCGILYPSEARPKIKYKSYDLSKAHVIKSVETSLSNLHTDYIDVLLIHRPSPLFNPVAISEAFSELHEQGKVLHFGVSNFEPHHVQHISSVWPIVSNQVEASLLHLDPFTNGIFDHAITNNYRPMIWSPLGGGKMFKESSDYNHVLRRQRLYDLAKSFGWTLDYMSYLFLLHHPAGLIPVTGSSNINRIVLAAKATETKITDEVWFRIWSASTGKKVP